MNNNDEAIVYMPMTASQVDIILNALDEKSISIKNLYNNIYKVASEQLNVNVEKREENNNMENKKIICKDCGKEFEFTVGEQRFFEEKGFAEPVRCKECRAAKKARNTEMESKSKDDNFEDMMRKLQDNTIEF